MRLIAYLGLLPWLYLLSGVGSPVLGAADAGIVTIETGRLQGIVEDGDVASYRGIPFAAPPVGDRRWRAPQAASSWVDVRKADMFSPECMQPARRAPGSPSPDMSEDCLYLNVWSPLERGAKKLPVMVWIYGGSFITGSGASPIYDGAAFARQGIVVVTFNYRLGRFGFFAHPALAKESPDGPLGNYGIMDQIAALQWVRQNIAGFGGDPGNVTIFGESAGAVFVEMLLASPMAKGLFHKAIAESAAATLEWISVHDAGMAAGKAWATAKGVPGDDPALLRAIPAETVLGAPGSTPTPSTMPMIDGKILPKSVAASFLAGEQQHVPLITGTNSFEQSLAFAFPDQVDGMLNDLGPVKDRALAIYAEGGKVPRDVAGRALWAEITQVGPTRMLARRMAASGKPTYLYRFSYVRESERGKAPGVPHGGELGYVFDTLGRSAATAEVASADRNTARLTNAYWASFAKTGNPNGGGRPNWPVYSEKTDELLEFTNDGPVTRKNFHKEGLDLIAPYYTVHLNMSEK